MVPLFVSCFKVNMNSAMDGGQNTNLRKGVEHIMKLLIIFMVLVFMSMFTGCVDIASVDKIMESEKSGIYSEKVIGSTTYEYCWGEVCGVPVIREYEVIYNNGNTFKISYGKSIPDRLVFQKEEVISTLLIEKQTNIQYMASFKDGRPWVYGELKGLTVVNRVEFDDAGRVDPRSTGDVDTANRFFKKSIEKADSVKQRFYDKELGNWQ